MQEPAQFSPPINQGSKLASLRHATIVFLTATVLGFFFAAQSITVGGSPTAAVLRFSARPGRTYTLLRCDSVGDGAWVPIADVPAVSSNRIVEVRNAIPVGSMQDKRFYRLVTPRLSP